MRPRVRFGMASVATRLLACAVLFVLATSFISCGGNTTSQPTFDEDLQQQMLQVVEESMAEQGVPGVIAAVHIPGRGEWTAACGVADLASGRAMAASDKVRIASNTKTFIATVVLQLVDEGRLSLDDPLEKYIPGAPYGNEITVRSLLNMTAGIFSFSEDEAFLVEFTADPLMEMEPMDGVNIAFAHPPDFAPGEGWHYSDTNYEILGIIVEQVTGNAIEDEVRERIIVPLSLDNTSFPTTPDMPAGSASGYVLSADGQLQDFSRCSPSVPWAGGAMISNLEDLEKWVKALATGELLSEEMHAEQLAWVDIPGLENADGKYGLGMMSLRGFQGHDGAIFGYNSIMLYLPEEDATMVVLANKSDNSSQETIPVLIALAKILFPERMSATGGQ